MIRVLVDGRIDAQDGIGRYTRCLVAALRAQAPCGVRISILPPTGTPRYSRGEGVELLQAARVCNADVVHALDYRVPLDHIEVPLVTTIHDVLRLVSPEYCYGDGEFATRFGAEGLDELALTARSLRRLAGLRPGTVREPRSLHEEFYARMLALACARSRRIVALTDTVSRQGAVHFAIGYGSVEPRSVPRRPALLAAVSSDPRPTCRSVKSSC